MWKPTTPGKGRVDNHHINPEAVPQNSKFFPDNGDGEWTE
jgi:hypothetical protein